MPPTFFPTPADFRRWLERHHGAEKELWVGFHKKGSGQPSITWPESVDEALCFGWIDGVRKRLDESSYVIRFSPRRTVSQWSAINIRRVAVLSEEGRMHPAGLAAFARRNQKPSAYSYENRPQELAPAYQEQLRANPKAWSFWQDQPPWYRRIASFWVMSAKRLETRERRLAGLIADSEAGRRIGLLKQSG